MEFIATSTRLDLTAIILTAIFLWGRWLLGTGDEVVDGGHYTDSWQFFSDN